MNYKSQENEDSTSVRSNSALYNSDSDFEINSVCSMTRKGNQAKRRSHRNLEKVTGNDLYSEYDYKVQVLSKENKKILARLFETDPEWKKETVEEATKLSKLSRYKVYKWGSDKKRRLISKMRKEINLKPAAHISELFNNRTSDLDKVVEEILFMVDHEYAA